MNTAQKREVRRAIGRRIRFARDELGMSTEALASALQVSPITVQRHMRGETLPDLVELLIYADTLAVEPGRLLPRLDSNQQPAVLGIAA